MNLSMKWLKEFVDVEVSPREYAEALTMSGSKVEGYTVENDGIDKVVAGKILSIEKHPDADKLVVCTVDVGAEDKLQIVTGAKNLAIGDLVPVATDGSTLPGGVKIKKGKLRGVLSQGMLCSLGELGLTKHDFPYAIEDGIFVLQEDCRLGQDICTAIGLDDVSVEFEITSNRPDCLSVIGLARETAVTFGTPLRLHTPVVKESGGNIAGELSVRMDAPDLCPRYMARVVKNVKIAPSPRWVRERLRASGVRPINNLVDITNYVMLEYGQPMHAFDYRCLAGGQINVRRAADGEAITTLDGAERKLTSRMLVIADAEKPVAVAGVMGGEYSGIADDTKTVVFESACFSGPSVRMTARDIGLRTDSSARFEKGLDAAGCAAALDRACELVELLGAGEVVTGVVDIDNSKKELRRIPLQPEWMRRFLGIDISAEAMSEILTNLGFGVENGEVVVPSFRADVEHKADVAEEIARIYGYNNIPTTKIRGSAQGKLTPEQKFEREISSTLLALSYDQILTYSFISPKYYDKIRLPKDSPLRNSVKISNPLGEDTSVMRATAIPSMLEILSGNYQNRNLTARLYELATEYLPGEDGLLPDERLRIVLGAYGGDMDFYTLKGAVESLLSALSVSGYEAVPEIGRPEFHPGRCAALTIDGAELGVLGEVHPKVLGNYDIDDRAYLAVLDFDTLFRHRQTERTYRPLPKFPAVTRDLALLCDIDTPVSLLQKAIAEGAGHLLEAVELFDVYQGKQIPDGKKSVAYSVTLRSSEATLTDQQTEKAVAKMISRLNAVGALLRQ